MVVGLIAEDGIVVASDGRVRDRENKEITTDKQVKIFKLSSQCVLLPAGAVVNNIEVAMDVTAGLLASEGLVGVLEIAKKICSVFNYSKNSWTNDDPNLTFILAGYEGMTPRVFYVMRRNGQWDINVPKPNPSLGSAGQGYKGVQALLLDAYAGSNTHTVKDFDVLAAKAILHAGTSEPEAVGGSMTIWNIKSGEEIIKLNKREICVLRQKAKLDMRFKHMFGKLANYR